MPYPSPTRLLLRSSAPRLSGCDMAATPTPSPHRRGKVQVSAVQSGTTYVRQNVDIAAPQARSDRFDALTQKRQLQIRKLPRFRCKPIHIRPPQGSNGVRRCEKEKSLVPRVPSTFRSALRFGEASCSSGSFLRNSILDASTEIAPLNRRKMKVVAPRLPRKRDPPASPMRFLQSFGAL